MAAQDTSSSGEGEDISMSTPPKVKKNKAMRVKAASKPITKKQAKETPIPTAKDTDLIDVRINENKGQSLYRKDDLLWCQACDCKVDKVKTSATRHVASKKHQANVISWNDKKKHGSSKRQTGIKDSIDRGQSAGTMRDDSVLASVISGVGGAGICRYNKLIQSKYRFRDGSHLVTDESSYESLFSFFFSFCFFFLTDFMLFLLFID